MPKEKEKHPIALYHPSADSYGDHRRVEKDSKEHKDLVASDPLWRDTPYAEKELADFKNKKQAEVAKPKRQDYKTKADFNAAMEEYKSAISKEEEGDE